MLRRVLMKANETCGKYGSIIRWYPRYRNRVEFVENIGAFERIFEQRKSLEPSDENIRRLVAAYQSAKLAQKAKPPHYNVSNEWLPIYTRYLGEIMGALASGDLGTVKARYRNFFREELSNGLVGLPTNMKRTYLSGRTSTIDKIWFVQDGVYRIDLWKKLLRGHSLTELDTPSIGNAYGLSSEGQFIRSGSEYHHYYAHATWSLLQGDGAGRGRRPVILELGGGYGGYAYFLRRLAPGHFTYVDVDLPETLALATFYLMSAFPESSFLLYGEDPGGRSLTEHDFVMMPCFEIESIEPGSVDVVFNSYSLAEMDAPTVRNYVTQFGRLRPRYVFHVNHTKNSSVGADSFGLEGAGFELVEKQEALWNLGRSITMDEFEYVYRCRS